MRESEVNGVPLPSHPAALLYITTTTTGERETGRGGERERPKW